MDNSLFDNEITGQKFQGEMSCLQNSKWIKNLKIIDENYSRPRRKTVYSLNDLEVQLSFLITSQSRSHKENTDKLNYIKIKLLWPKTP